MELFQEIFLSNLLFCCSAYYLWKRNIKKISFYIASKLENKNENKLSFHSLFLKSFHSLENKKLLINHTFYNSLIFDYINYKHNINIINKFLLALHIYYNSNNYVILINENLILKLKGFRFKNIFIYFLKYPKYSKIMNSRKYDILEKYLSHLLIHFNPIFIIHIILCILMDILHYSALLILLFINYIKDSILT